MENENPIHDIESLRKGGDRAWDLLIEQFYKPIYYYIYGITRHAEESEELTQDVFVNLWAKRENLQIEISLKAYLYRAARNHTLNHIKRKAFETNYHRGLAKRPQELGLSAEQDFQFSELQKQLHEAIQDLPEKCREVFSLSRFEELSYKEIADTLQIPIRQVHYQISIALKELRQKLTHWTDETILCLWVVCSFFSFLL